MLRLVSLSPYLSPSVGGVLDCVCLLCYRGCQLVLVLRPLVICVFQGVVLLFFVLFISVDVSVVLTHLLFFGAACVSVCGVFVNWFDVLLLVADMFSRLLQ